MSTRAEILNGALFEGYEDFCADVVNAIITHYRVSDPCVNMVARQPGEILSDPDDDKLHHVGGASGYPCDEILQATRSCDVIPEFKGVDYYDVCNGDYARIVGIDEPGLGHRLTIGLDETARTMVICDLGDVGVDLGLGVQADPTLYVFKNDANVFPAYIRHNLMALTGAEFYIYYNFGVEVLLSSRDKFKFRLTNDLVAGDAYTFESSAGIELTDANAEQTWMYLEPKINQTLTAGYIAILVNVTETSLGDASAGAGYNALMDLRIAGVSYFAVQNNGMQRLSDGTDVHYFGSYQEPGLGGRLTVGLDETARTMVICDAGDIYVDFGLAVEANPSLIIFDAAGAVSAKFGRHTILPQVDEAATPTLAFGDGDTGFYEIADDTLGLAHAGMLRFYFRGFDIRGVNANSGAIKDETASATNPVLVLASDTDCGLGIAAADQPSLIAGGVEGIRISEAAGLIDVSVFGNLTRKFTVTIDDVDGNETHLVATMLGGLIRRGTGNQLTANRTDISDTAANIVAAIPGCIVGSGFEFSIANEDGTHTVSLDGGVGITMIPNDPSTAIPVLSTGRFLAVVTNIGGGTEALNIYALGYSIH